MSKISRFPILALLLALPPAAYPAPPSETPSVVTTIKPLHALAGSVAGNILEPALLLHQQQSPHDYRLTPSAARLLGTSDLVVWVGPGLETQLAIPLQGLAPPERRLDLALRPEMKLLPLRGGGTWEGEHEHAERADADSHLWLDADNALAILDILQARLGKLDPAHAGSYRQNAARAASDIRAADAAIRQLLETARPRPYWVLHDSLQYFEKRYGLEGAGAIMVNPDRIPGAKRVLELRGQLRTQNIGCILYEERYGRRWIEVLIEDSNVKAIPIDPLGLELEEGADFYPKLLFNLAQQIAQCH
ncbi:MAG TPA: zinc ABC transporter substrate-binding protein [Gammaproteobacteria bacterium]|nr:zinc ABC transporter substrate-binding protein [Gammaproteobacteria bacterium]